MTFIREAAVGVSSDFIFQPGGTAVDNVYDNFAVLYADLTASSVPKKRVILDDSVTSPVNLPAGTFNLAGVTLTNGKVSDQGGAYTHISWNPAAVIQNVARIENLMSLVAASAARLSR